MALAISFCMTGRRGRRPGFPSIRVVRREMTYLTPLFPSLAMGALSLSIPMRPIWSAGIPMALPMSLCTTARRGPPSASRWIAVRSRRTPLPPILPFPRTGALCAFASNATNLVSGDTNTRTDIFVRDRVMGRDDPRHGQFERRGSGPGRARALRSRGMGAMWPFCRWPQT